MLLIFMSMMMSMRLATISLTLGQTVTIIRPKFSAQIGEKNVVLRCIVKDLTPFNDNYVKWIYYPAWKPGGFVIYSSYNDINNDPANFTVYTTTPFGDSEAIVLVVNIFKPELDSEYRCQLDPVVSATVVIIESIIIGVFVLGALYWCCKYISEEVRHDKTRYYTR